MAAYTYSTKSNTGVDNNGTNGAKLNKGSSSYSDYIQSCQNNCNADNTCYGFVDDFGQCNPKTQTGINTTQNYSPGKTLYIKGTTPPVTTPTSTVPPLPVLSSSNFSENFIDYYDKNNQRNIFLMIIFLIIFIIIIYGMLY